MARRQKTKAQKANEERRRAQARAHEESRRFDQSVKLQANKDAIALKDLRRKPLTEEGRRNYAKSAKDNLQEIIDRSFKGRETTKPAPPQSPAARRSTLPELPVEPIFPEVYTDTPPSRLPGQLAHYKNEVRMATTPKAKKFAERKVKELTIALTKDDSSPIVVPATKEGRELFEARKGMGFTGDRYESAVPVDEHAEALKEAGKRTVKKPDLKDYEPPAPPPVDKRPQAQKDADIARITRRMAEYPGMTPLQAHNAKLEKRQADIYREWKEGQKVQKTMSKAASSKGGKWGAVGELAKAISSLETEAGSDESKSKTAQALNQILNQILKPEPEPDPEAGRQAAEERGIDARASSLAQPPSAPTERDLNDPSTWRLPASQPEVVNGIRRAPQPSVWSDKASEGAPGGVWGPGEAGADSKRQQQERPWDAAGGEEQGSMIGRVGGKIKSFFRDNYDIDGLREQWGVGPVKDPDVVEGAFDKSLAQRPLPPDPKQVEAVQARITSIMEVVGPMGFELKTDEGGNIVGIVKDDGTRQTVIRGTRQVGDEMLFAVSETGIDGLFYINAKGVRVNIIEDPQPREIDGP